MRFIFGSLSVIAIPYLFYQTFLFYSGVAPFHQLYYEATADQYSIVTKQLLITLFVLPTWLMLLIFSIRPQVFCCSWSRGIKMLGIIFVLAGIQEQALHLALTYRSGFFGLLIGVLLLLIPYLSKLFMRIDDDD